MRKAVFALVLLAGVSQSANAQSTAWANKLFAGDLVHDFGSVPRGKQLKYSFKMVNIYKVPLTITHIRVTCGCLTAKESSRTIQPGETAYLNINMDTTRFSGPKTITINMDVGPDFVSTATLTVQANARSDVVFNPGEIDFGMIHRGQTTTRHIDVEYAGNFPWAVTEIVKSSSAPFELKVEELRNRGNKGYRIFATAKTDAPSGTFKQEIILKTNDPATPTLTFNVLGNVQATLKVSPDVVNLANTKVGAMETRKVIVQGSRPFRILGIDGQGDGVTAQLPDREAATHIVEIRFQPTRSGETKKQLTIRTNMEKEAVTVTVLGGGI